jgi:transcriptional regulator with PAS, ATPase and Fis domain
MAPDEEQSLSSAYRAQAFIFEMMRSQTRQMQDCLRMARTAAANDLTVLITGESGTGKNLLAQAIHNASARSGGPFVVVNCSALSESLIESELFGHERGAYTGAEALRKGQFELAAGGTLLLDEIGDMALPAQAKILHAVEYKQFQRLGGQQRIETDARIIAATNQDLGKLVQNGSFREDLYYRLRELHLEVLPLRERREDLERLVKHFLVDSNQKLGRALTGLSAPAMDLLRRHGWPGNIRELKTLIRRAAMSAVGEQIGVEDLRLAEPDQRPDAADLTLRAAERRQIERVLRLARGNKRKASRILDIARNTLEKKIQDFGIDVEQFREE